MSTPKYIFYLIYFIFHVLLVGGSIYMMNKLGESDYGWINSFVSGENFLFNEGNIIIFSVFGLLLFLANVVMVNIQISGSRKEKEKLANEVNSLKAKLYDLQDARDPKPVQHEPETGNRESSPENKPNQ